MDSINVLTVFPSTRYRCLVSMSLNENGWHMSEGTEMTDLVKRTTLVMECIMHDCDGEEDTIISFRSERDGTEFPFYRWPEIKMVELMQMLDEGWIEEI